MPAQPPRERARSFVEVNEGYTEARARFEASRCLRCQTPSCEDGCPVGVPIRSFLEDLAEGRVAEAYRKIRRANSLPAVCGRVCPQESQCEARCHLATRFDPVGIGHLERFAADWERAHRTAGGGPVAAPQGPRVAVVGSGPAGLAAAGDLAGWGYRVTIFEALHEPGGVLRYGIPEFRLPKAILDDEVDGLRRQGVEVVCNVVVGRTVTLRQLREEMGFQAVFIGTGAGLPRFLGIPGEQLNGVYSANEFLTRINLMRAYKFPEYHTPLVVGGRVAVVGGGNTAMDAARSALRMGAAEVSLVYRRSEAEMTARIEEYHHAKEEGVAVRWLTNPVRVWGSESGSVEALECQPMTLGEPDASGRRRPVPSDSPTIRLPVETVVIAIGTAPNRLLAAGAGLSLTERGGLVVAEETGETSVQGIFAGGDAVTGAATVILAAGAGRKAAAAIHHRLMHAGFPSPSRPKPA